MLWMQVGVRSMHGLVKTKTVHSARCTHCSKSFNIPKLQSTLKMRNRWDHSAHLKPALVL